MGKLSVVAASISCGGDVSFGGRALFYSGVYLSYSGPALSGGGELGGGESLAHGGLWPPSSGMTWAISGGGITWAGFPYSGLGALEEASSGGAWMSQIRL